MESGAFNSPNYPDPYPANVECVWTIRSSPGNRLQLSFMSVNINVDSSDLEKSQVKCRCKAFAAVGSLLIPRDCDLREASDVLSAETLSEVQGE